MFLFRATAVLLLVVSIVVLREGQFAPLTYVIHAVLLVKVSTGSTRSTTVIVSRVVKNWPRSPRPNPSYLPYCHPYPRNGPFVRNFLDLHCIAILFAGLTPCTVGSS